MKADSSKASRQMMCHGMWFDGTGTVFPSD